MSERTEQVLNQIPDAVDKVPLSDEKFLGFFEPFKIDNELLFGIPLKTGVKILSLLILIRSISSFINILKPETLWKLIINVIIFIVLFATALYAYFSTVRENYGYAKVAYIVLAVIFAYQAIIYLCKSLLKIIEFITPWDGDFLNFDFIVYVLGYGAYLFVILYFIWVLYCYMRTLKGGVVSVDNNVEDVEKAN